MMATQSVMENLSTVVGGTELSYLLYSTIFNLLLLPLLLLALSTCEDPCWGSSNRARPIPKNYQYGIRGRINRTWSNGLDGLVFFGIAVGACCVQGISTPTTIMAARVYFHTRIVYSFLYILGVPVVRSVVWVINMATTIVILCEAARCDCVGSLGLEHVDKLIDYGFEMYNAHVVPLMAHTEL